jgi:hypothetical protein
MAHLFLCYPSSFARGVPCESHRPLADTVAAALVRFVAISVSVSNTCSNPCSGPRFPSALCTADSRDGCHLSLGISDSPGPKGSWPSRHILPHRGQFSRGPPLFATTLYSIAAQRISFCPGGVKSSTATMLYAVKSCLIERKFAQIGRFWLNRGRGRSPDYNVSHFQRRTYNENRGRSSPATTPGRPIGPSSQVYPISRPDSSRHFPRSLRWTVGRPTVDFSGYRALWPSPRPSAPYIPRLLAPFNRGSDDGCCRSPCDTLVARFGTPVA